MLLAFLLTTLISTTVSAPAPNWPRSSPYVPFCASAFYNWDYEWFAGMYPWERCDEIFFNVTRGEYQPAVGYNIKKGSWCKFYESMSDCQAGLDTPMYVGPLPGTEEDEYKGIPFEGPLPLVYKCGLTG